MKEIFETLSDELRRVAAEGDDFVALDDESLGILKKLSSHLSPDAGRAEEDFVDDVEEVKFVSAEDFGAIEKAA